MGTLSLKPKPKKLSQGELLSRVMTGRLKEKKRKTRAKDKMKFLRFKNKLQRMRLKNEIEKFKIKVKVERMIRKGTLPMPKLITQPTEFRYFEDETVNRDVKSAFNADMGHGDNLFGPESWFGGEVHYGEDFMGDEFNDDPFKHLGLNVQRGLNPLLY